MVHATSMLFIICIPLSGKKNLVQLKYPPHTPFQIKTPHVGEVRIYNISSIFSSCIFLSAIPMLGQRGFSNAVPSLS